MRCRLLLPILATVALLSTSACNRDFTDNSTSTPDTPTVEVTADEPVAGKPAIRKPKHPPIHRPQAPTPQPAPPAAKPLTISADGLGPYVIGAKMSRLKADGFLLNNYEYDACPFWAIAGGTRGYGSPGLSFWHGKLISVSVEDNTPTDRGIKVGAALSAVKAQYPHGKKITVGPNAVTGWFVEDGDHALVFDYADGVVERIEAGTAQFEKDGPSATQGC
jgi:hypothetical protein